MGAFSFNSSVIKTPLDTAQQDISSYSDAIAGAFPENAPGKPWPSLCLATRHPPSYIRHHQRPTRPALTTASLCAALPGWVRGYEFHILVGLALLVVLRLVWVKTGAKSEAVAAKAEEMEKKITAGYPWATACVAAFVIIGNCLVLGGVLTSLDKFKLVTTQIDASAAAVDASSISTAADIRRAYAAYNGFASTAHAAIATTQDMWEASYETFFQSYVPWSEPGNESSYAATAALAKAKLEVDAPYAINTLHAIFVGNEDISVGTVRRTIEVNRPKALATEVEMNSMYTALDELVQANTIFGTVAKLAMKNCLTDNVNCTIGEMRLSGATSHLPELRFEYFAGLEAVDSVMEQISNHYRGWHQGYSENPPDWCARGHRVQCARTLWNTPKDVLYTAEALGAADFAAGTFGALPQKGRDKHTMEQMLPLMAKMSRYELNRSPIRQLFRNIKNMLVYNNDTLTQQHGAIKRGFEDALSQITYVRKACLAWRSLAIKTGEKIVVHLKWPAICTCAFGILVAVQVLLWAIATANPGRAGVTACINSYFAFLSYGFLYLLLDVFVLVSFCFIFAAMILVTHHNAMADSCSDLGDGHTRTALSMPACQTINGDLRDAIKLSTAGVFINFFASYHLLVALQGTHSRYVNGAMDAAKADEAAPPGEDGVSAGANKKFIL